MEHELLVPNLAGATCVGWFTDVIEATWQSKVSEMKRYGAVILRPDVQYFDWGHRMIAAMAGTPLLAYVRAPVHYKSKDVWPVAKYEYQVKRLIEGAGAQVYDIWGRVQGHPSGYDTYCSPDRLDVIAHASLTAEHVWRTGVWAGILADGLVTNQIYCASPSTMDMNRNHVPDVQEWGWPACAARQRNGLRKWCHALAGYGVPVIANGGWEPSYIGLDGRYNARWPPEFDYSWLIDYVGGIMAERFGEYPYYAYAPNPPVTGPVRSELWDCYSRNIYQWLEKGRVVLVGGENWGGGTAGRNFVSLSAQLLGALPLYLAPSLGKRLSGMLESGTKKPAAFINSNWGKVHWIAQFEKGVIHVEPAKASAYIRK
jgi:hypothetical protein